MQTVCVQPMQPKSANYVVLNLWQSSKIAATGMLLHKVSCLQKLGPKCDFHNEEGAWMLYMGIFLFNYLFP